MSGEPTPERVAQLVAETVLRSTGRQVPIQPDTSLLRSGLLDSMTMVDLVLVLQAETGVQLDVVDLDEAHFETAAAIAALLARRRA